jgi:tRNA U34 5-methylaminomethyl-2-thiouridine-forming methyltransferase MnmC
VSNPDDHPETDSIEPFETRDGSYSLIDRDRDLHYSSTPGAADEARHVFVAGTQLVESASGGETGRVLEFGFGGGVNFVQAVRALRDAEAVDHLIYHAVEYRPVAGNTVEFHSGQTGEMVREALDRARVSDGDAVDLEANMDGELNVELHLHPIRWRELQLSGFEADSIFFDPFGPRSQPEAWETEAFEIARQYIGPAGRLATYSAASDVKRALFEAGFHVASAPGAGPKREMTVASPSQTALGELDQLDRSNYL